MQRRCESEASASDDVLNAGMHAVGMEGYLATVCDEEFEEAPVVRSGPQLLDAGGARGVLVVVSAVAVGSIHRR